MIGLVASLCHQFLRDRLLAWLPRLGHLDHDIAQAIGACDDFQAALIETCRGRSSMLQAREGDGLGSRAGRQAREAAASWWPPPDNTCAGVDDNALRGASVCGGAGAESARDPRGCAPSARDGRMARRAGVHGGSRHHSPLRHRAGAAHRDGGAAACLTSTPPGVPPALCCPRRRHAQSQRRQQAAHSLVCLRTALADAAQPPNLRRSGWTGSCWTRSARRAPSLAAASCAACPARPACSRGRTSCDASSKARSSRRRSARRRRRRRSSSGKCASRSSAAASRFALLLTRAA